MCMLMEDDIIYQGISRVGNLRTIVHMVEVSSFLRGTNVLTFPMGRKLTSNMSHHVLRLSSSLALRGSMSRMKG